MWEISELVFGLVVHDKLEETLIVKKNKFEKVLSQKTKTTTLEAFFNLNKTIEKNIICASSRIF